MSSTVQIFYWPIRGRAEVVRLICAVKGVPFDVLAPDNMKTDLEHYCFGQAPRMVDGDVDMCQSNAMIRHMARKHDLYGSTLKESAHVDMILDGVESLRVKYVPLIYMNKLEATAKETFWTTHCDRETSVSHRNGGAHMDYLARLLNRNGGSFCAGSSLTVADLALFEFTDLLLRIFKEQIEATYPELIKFHSAIAAHDSIKAYLTGPQRCEQPNNNGLG